MHPEGAELNDQTSVASLHAMVFETKWLHASAVQRVGPKEEPCDQSPWEKEHGDQGYEEWRFPAATGISRAKSDESSERSQQEANDQNR
jgi:hypothetical protein